MAITMSLCIPCKMTPKVRVLPSQKVGIINNIKLFGPKNKMLFVAKGQILPYNKTMNECNLSNGDIIFALRINSNFDFFDNLLNSDQEINFSQIKNNVPIFGRCYDANLTSLNKIIIMSQNNIDIAEYKHMIQSKMASNEIARIHDLKIMKRENCKKLWKKQIFAKMQKESEKNSMESTNIKYETPKEPSCDALPTLL